jgi:hypothetical protein
MVNQGVSIEIIEPNNNDLFRITSISTLSQESISNIWLDRENKYTITPKSYYDYISVPFRSQSTITTSKLYGYPIIPKFLKNEFSSLYKSSFSISLITTFFAILYTLLGLIPLPLGIISIFLLLFNTIFALINWKKKR